MRSPHAAPAPPLIITLEMTRARAAGDPHAFAAGAQSYLLREAGGVYHGFELVWDQALAEDLFALSRPRAPQEVVERLGARLRNILQLVAWERHDEAIGRARAEGRRVIVDVLSAAAELYTLPWELVPLRSSGARLAELPDLLVRYAWPATATKVQPERPVGGKLLFVWSDAAAPVPWSEQEQVIREAVSSLRGLTPLDVEVLPRANPTTLKQALEAKPSIVHILCHGRSGADGGLVLHDALGHDEEVVTPQALGALLAPAVGHLQQLVLCACGSGAWSSVASPLGSLAQVAHRLGVPTVVAFRIPVTIDGAQVVTEALYDGLLRRLSSLEDAHLNAQSALVKRESLDWAALQLLARAEDGEDTRPVLIRPYRGLLPFRRAHRPLYFGCERVIDEVVRELDALVKTPELPDLLFLAGASGVGKSSLLNAGVLPALEELWPGLVIQSMRPGATPLATLNQAAEGFGQGPTLLVVDQLEELFTNGAPRDELTAFAARLWEILATGVRCIAAIRGDYLDRLGEIAVPGGRRLDSYAYDDAHRVFIGRLRPDELREAIVRPAAVVGLQFEPGLVERVLEDIGEEPGALPLVQHCMDQLWEHREGRIFTLQAYEVEIGGVDGALSRHADAVLSALSEADQRLAQRLLCELVVYRGEIATATRQRLPLAHLHRELRDEAAIARVLDALVNARLLVRDEGDPRHPATVEIAHEALVRRWPTLGQWLTEGAESRAARDWLRALANERATEPNFVLQGAQLVAAAEIRQRFAGELSDELLAFIAASEAAEADRVRREQAARDAEIARIAAQARRAARALIVSVVVGVVVLGLIGVALYMGKKAQDNALAANIAQVAAREAEQAALTATQISERKVREAADAELRAQEAIAREADADEKARLATERERLANTATKQADLARRRAMAEALAAQAAADEAASMAAASLAQLEVTRQALAEEAAQAKAQKLLRIAGEQTDPTFRALVLREIESPENHPDWLQLTLGVADEPIARMFLQGLNAPASQIRFSGDSSRVAAGNLEGDVIVWSTADGQEVSRIELGDSIGVHEVTLNEDGTRLMTWTVDGVATIWDVSREVGVSVESVSTVATGDRNDDDDDDFYQSSTYLGDDDGVLSREGFDYRYNIGSAIISPDWSQVAFLGGFSNNVAIQRLDGPDEGIAQEMVGLRIRRSLTRFRFGTVRFELVDLFDRSSLDGASWTESGESLVLWQAGWAVVLDPITGQVQHEFGIRASIDGYLPSIDGPGCLMFADRDFGYAGEEENYTADYYSREVRGFKVVSISPNYSCPMGESLSVSDAERLGVVWSRHEARSDRTKYPAISADGRYIAASYADGIVRLGVGEDLSWELHQKVSQRAEADRALLGAVTLAEKSGEHLHIHQASSTGSSLLRSLPSQSADCELVVCTEDGIVCAMTDCSAPYTDQVLMLQFGVDAEPLSLPIRWLDGQYEVYEPASISARDLAISLDLGDEFLISTQRDLAISADGQAVAIGMDGSVLVWRKGGQQDALIPLGESLIGVANQVEFAADGSTVLFAEVHEEGVVVSDLKANGARRDLFLLPATEVIHALERLPGADCVAFGLTGRVGRWCEGDIAPKLEPERFDDYPVTSLHLAADGETLIVGSASGNRLVNAADLSTRLTLPTCGLERPSVIIDSALTSAFLFNNSATCVVPLTVEPWRETLWDASDVCLTPDQRLSLGLGDAQEVELAYQACLTRVNLPPRP